MEKLMRIHRTGWKHRWWTIPAIYLLNWLLLLDHAVAALFGFDQRLTISAIFTIFWKKKDCKICKFICRLLDKVDEEHCTLSIRRWKIYRLFDRSIWNIIRWEDLNS